MRSKVTVVGAGNVGATTAQRIFDKGHADVVLVDIVEGLPQGKALDMLESGPVVGSDANVVGTNGYEETADSDVVVITSGIARKPGMSRDDLLLTNMKIVTSVVEEVVECSPECVLMLVTNPLDAMAQRAFQVSGFPKNRVVGQAGILDTARFRTFLSAELGVSVDSITAWVLGGHGDTMVPVVGSTTVGGQPVADLISPERLDEIVKRTQDGGAEIVGLLKTGSAYYAPSAAVAQMVDAVLLDKKQILPCTTYLEGEYGIDGLFVGVPVKLGAGRRGGSHRVRPDARGGCCPGEICGRRPGAGRRDGRFPEQLGETGGRLHYRFCGAWLPDGPSFRLLPWRMCAYLPASDRISWHVCSIWVACPQGSIPNQFQRQERGYAQPCSAFRDTFERRRQAAEVLRGPVRVAH